MAQPTDDRPKASATPSIKKADHESGQYNWKWNKCKLLLFQNNQCCVKVNGKQVTYERKPSDQEISELKVSFETLLGDTEMDFKAYCNSSAGELANIFDAEFQNNEKNMQFDCFIFLFITFGEDDRIFFWEGDISIANILEPIKKKQSMALKPKIFFIQSSDERYINPVNGIVLKGTEAFETRKVPQEADFFIFHSIIPESLFPVKERHENESVFLTALKEAVKNPPRPLDIHKLSLRINAKVFERLQNEKCVGKHFDKLPIPEVTSTLTKALYFPCALSVPRVTI
ncbi:hypothetical protein CHS0354_030444 [Potamilus streckersoni]|uniref:Peptidase C14A caspase catalytic domain-containing protein n=1 Tax=Potamilus streckersoni TaxID=2493646 RepID=A0AAE0SI07_9BIVA|nr:hypothetical protein CHS0354_030444 [Potamilus streckersoni]